MYYLIVARELPAMARATSPSIVRVIILLWRMVPTGLTEIASVTAQIV